jgi:hypothetical protein
MELQFSLGDPSKGSLQINRNGSSYLLKYPCSSGSSCTFYETTLPKGIFLLELWGSQGGNTNAGGVGGKGGYSRGILNLTKETKAFIHIGGQPANTTGGVYNYMQIYGGYNGGGGSVQNSDCNGSGGGTDIRLNENTLYHRLIVSGGGGGGYTSTSYTSYYAGAGGGLEGQASGYGPSTNAGKREKGGEGGYIGSGGTHGSFGLGGNHGGRSAGGGGGWFGGGGSSNNAGTTGGGGGSGYVFNSTSYKPEGFKLTSEFYLIEGTTIQGTQLFLSPEGITETGHIGHGSVRITVLRVSINKQCTYAKCFINIFQPLTSLIQILLSQNT